MRSYWLSVFLFVLSFACSTNHRYDINSYHGVAEKDSIFTSIVTYLFTPPPYTTEKDRFKPAHRKFYSAQTKLFSIEKYYVDATGKHYFLVFRPGPKSDEKRAVGGYFRLGRNFELIEFREAFVTPLLSGGDLKTRGGFLFEEMVKGSLDSYLKMKMYVQWPNEISHYDTVTYEWKLNTGMPK